MNRPIISIRDVRESSRLGRNCVDALEGVSFDTREGERIATAGKSGSGASALTHGSCVRERVIRRQSRRFRLLICDNDEVYRIGLCEVLKSLPEIVIVGQTAEAASALELSEVFAPHIALVSSELGGAELPLTEALNRQGVRMVMLAPQTACETDRTKHPDEDGRDYLRREADSVEVVDRIRAALPV